MARTIKVNYLARVEGEGALTIRFAGDRAKSVELNIFEPPRFFEAFLVGRGFSEVPDITARICGICPVSYQMSSCHALEAACGVAVGEQLRRLRRLLYAGEWVESHGLHMFMLHLPDFLGYQDALGLAKQHPELVQAGLAIKKAGNRIVQVLGGREIHPINVKLGGFYQLPPVSEMAELLAPLAAAQKSMDEALDFFAKLEFPEFDRDYEFVALRHSTDYPFNEGRIVSSRGIDIEPHQFDDTFREHHVSRSTALHASVIGRGGYVCGPLARINLNFDRLRPAALAAAQRIGFEVPCTNPFRGILARGLETLNALDEAREIIDNYRQPGVAAVEVSPRAGIGHACTEAPRGLQYQRYELDEHGDVVAARIVPPTSQNQRSIEEDLFEMAPELAKMEHGAATWRAEQAIRNYDPCISCSTHFLKLKVERQ
jgi:coenzyme F420-reducing hydrogenase alpha subunit